MTDTARLRELLEVLVRRDPARAFVVLLEVARPHPAAHRDLVAALAPLLARGLRASIANERDQSRGVP